MGQFKKKINILADFPRFIWFVIDSWKLIVFANLHPVYGAGIRTCNIQNMSLLL